MDQAGEQVLPEIIGAERVRPAGWFELGREIDVVNRHRPERGAGDDGEDEQGEHDETDHREPVLAKAAPGLARG